MKFQAREVILPDQTPLVIEALPPTSEAAQDFLAVEQQGYISAYQNTPAQTETGETCIVTAVEAGAMFNPRSTQQIQELVAISAGTYETTKDITLLRATTEEDGQPYTAGVLNLIQGDIRGQAGEVYVVKIHELHTHPSFRRRLVAAALMLIATETVTLSYDSSDSQLMLHSGIYNHTAREWYESMGILRTGQEFYHTWPNGLRIPHEERVIGLVALRDSLRERYSSRIAQT